MTATPPKNVHVGMESTWLRLKAVAQIIALSVGATVIIMRFENRMNALESTMLRDVQDRKDEREALIQSVNGVRDEMRKVFVDSVATRQAQAWIELARALNRNKFPELVFPDLPR